MHRLLAAAMVALLLTRCGSEAKEQARQAELRQQQLQAEADRLKGDLEEARREADEQKRDADRLRGASTELSRQNRELLEEGKALRQEVEELRRQVVTEQAQMYVYEALALHFYRELEQGRRPEQMVSPTGGGFVFIKEGSPSLWADTPAEVDWDPLIKWAKTHPTSQIERLSSMRGQPGYYVVHMRVSGGFYIRAIIHKLTLTHFMIKTEPFGMT